jgi:hypothetical protein
MNTTPFADFIVNFDHDADKHICQETTEAVRRSTLPVRLLFPDQPAFLRHRDRHGGGVRVAFADAERIVHGTAQTHIALLPLGVRAADEKRIAGDLVIVTDLILYSDPEVAVEDMIRAIKAGLKQG